MVFGYNAINDLGGGHLNKSDDKGGDKAHKQFFLAAKGEVQHERTRGRDELDGVSEEAADGERTEGG
mgnify:CR=1 FL=1